MIQSGGAHVVLLQFVAAEDYQALGVILPQHHFDKFLAERTGAAGDQNDLLETSSCHAPHAKWQRR